jgi:GT2 family glycosyltransferase
MQVDIIMLSYASSSKLKKLTSCSVRSLLRSEPKTKISFNVVVIESNDKIYPFQYPGTTTIYPRKKFGYHKFMNIGIKNTDSPYICLCNNDLEFSSNWASEMKTNFDLDEELVSASPIDPDFHIRCGISENSGLHYGYTVRRELVGWCIFLRRSALNIIGPLDPTFKFWYADNDYAKTLQKFSLKHALISTSVVKHLESQTLKTRHVKDQYRLTLAEKFYYEYKWEGRSYYSYLYQKRKIHRIINNA